MYLTKEEEKALEGEYGEAIAMAMRILVTLGEMNNAERLIKINSAHVSGISYVNIGEEGLEFILKMAEAKVKVRTTCNPACMDLERWRDLGISEHIAEGQLRIAEALRDMNIEETFTCTPYFVGNRPSKDSHVSWGESSAVVFANTFLEARTNREGGPSALASAIVGKTPLYGLHLEENRRPTVRVKIEYTPSSLCDYSMVGYIIGYRIQRGIPLVEGLKVQDEDQAKAFSAGLAAASNVSMAILKPQPQPLEVVEIDEKEVKEYYERFNIHEKPDLIFIGCPHCSLEELMYVDLLIKKPLKGVEFWMCTSRGVYMKAKRRGIIDSLESKGVKVLKDMCIVVTKIRDMGYESVWTNSSKAAHYLKLLHGVKVRLCSIKSIVSSITKRANTP
ncbi:MAG: hypothetical protein DRN15_02585 [Thermoprotei archaeon]|nr:MAG: hypothetical protein DRM97_04715 [Thermoprotei archaeon]RLF24559.1 MAG: hypothetical protein DRN15_02585 [Thermoprotei archaeon]